MECRHQNGSEIIGDLVTVLASFPGSCMGGVLSPPLELGNEAALTPVDSVRRLPQIILKEMQSRYDVEGVNMVNGENTKEHVFSFYKNLRKSVFACTSSTFTPLL